MNYILQVTRRDERPEYAEEMKSYLAARNNQYMDKPYQPQRYEEVSSLNVEITEAQFEAIRKAVIDNF